MLTVDRELERVLTVEIHDAVIDAEVVSGLGTVLDDVERGGVETLVLRFGGGAEPVTGHFPRCRPDEGRPDMRFFARWDETVARISRLKAKTFAAYDGTVGAAAVHVGL